MTRSKTLSRTLSRRPVHSRNKGPGPSAVAPAGPFLILTGKKLIAALCVLLAGATVALYSPVFGHSFVVYDDSDYITTNLHLREGLSWSTIRWAFTSTEKANWHPLTWLSHALDYQLFGLSPAGHHLDSVLLHAVNVVVLFLLLLWMTRRIGPSVCVAALFAVHPLNVESVAWVAERKNVLCTLFFLLTIAAYAWYARKPDWRRYLLVAALVAAALMAKPMAITLPFVLLLLDYWPLDRMPLKESASNSSTGSGLPRVSLTRLLLEKIPLLALSAASALITLKAQRGAMPVSSKFPLPVRIENAIVSYGLYLWKTVWPVQLAALYLHPSKLLPAWQLALSGLVLAGITALVVLFRRKRYLPVGWFWFLGTLIPVAGLVQVGNQAMADRYAYIPLIGIFAMIAWGADDLAEARKVPTLWRVIPTLCILTALGFATLRQIGYWDSEYDLWAHALAIDETNVFAHDALAAALLNPSTSMTRQNLEGFDTPGFDTEQKRMAEARQHYEQALNIRRELAQQNPAAYLPEIAMTEYSLENFDPPEVRIAEARQHYEEALRSYHQLARQNVDADLPFFAKTLNDFALWDANQNRIDEAREHYEEALSIYRELAQQAPGKYLPDMFTALNNLGNLDLSQNRMDEARQHYEEGLKIQSQLEQQNPGQSWPGMAMAMANLGNLDWRQNRPDEAREHFEESLKIYRPLAQEDSASYLPEMVTALNNLGNLDRQQNRMDEARRCYEEALKAYRQLAQQDAGKYLPYVGWGLQNLGNLDRQQNRVEESQAYYREALTLFRKLQEGDSKYAGDVAGVEASLRELERTTHSQ